MTAIRGLAPERGVDVRAASVKFRVILIGASLLVAVVTGFLGTSGTSTTPVFAIPAIGFLGVGLWYVLSLPVPAPGGATPGVRIGLKLFGAAVLLAGLGGLLDASGTGGTKALGVPLVCFLVVNLWRRPYLGPGILLGAAILVEQAGEAAIPITPSIPLFQGIGPGHLQGGDVLILLVAFVYFVKRESFGAKWWPRTHVSIACLCLLGAACWGIAIGQAHHGDLREAFQEARPIVYVVATYFLTSVMITDRKALMSVLWAFVITVDFKALQGLYVYFKHRHDYPPLETVIGHEASYFFVAYFILVLALWLFNQPGQLRTVATRLLPVVIACDLVNDRRAAWEMLGGAVMCFGVIAYQTAPMRRHLMGKGMVILLLASAVYFPVFWNKSGSAAQPARAIRSQITPSVRDASSDLYRVQEDANLELNVKQGGLLGKGFGIKIDYALPIVDIAPIDPGIAYVPHNDILYYIVRMGVIGAVAMWTLVAVGIIAGARLARSKDRLTAVIGIMMASSLVAYTLMGAVDQGFFWYRIAFMTGTFLGLGEAARRLQRDKLVSKHKAPTARSPALQVK